jgi:hypothetical protein
MKEGISGKPPAAGLCPSQKNLAYQTQMQLFEGQKLVSKTETCFWFRS